MTSRRADDLPRQIAKLQQKVDSLDRLASRQGHVHGGLFRLEQGPNIDVGPDTQITITHSFHVVSDAVAARNLDTILVSSTVSDEPGTILNLRFGGSNTITIKDAVGNIHTAGDFAMGPRDHITLIRVGSVWEEISRSAN